MTQLYSNLVNYMNSTTYLCLVLALLCSLVVLGIRLASMDPLKSAASRLMSSLASIPPLY